MPRAEPAATHPPCPGRGPMPTPPSAFGGPPAKRQTRGAANAADAPSKGVYFALDAAGRLVEQPQWAKPPARDALPVAHDAAQAPDAAHAHTLPPSARHFPPAAAPAAHYSAGQTADLLTSIRAGLGHPVQTPIVWSVAGVPPNEALISAPPVPPPYAPPTSDGGTAAPASEQRPQGFSRKRSLAAASMLSLHSPVVSAPDDAPRPLGARGATTLNASAFRSSYQPLAEQRALKQGAGSPALVTLRRWAVCAPGVLPALRVAVAAYSPFARFQLDSTAPLRPGALVFSLRMQPFGSPRAASDAPSPAAAVCSEPRSFSIFQGPCPRQQVAAAQRAEEERAAKEHSEQQRSAQLTAKAPRAPNVSGAAGAPAKRSRGTSAAAEGATTAAPPAQVSAVELPTMAPESSTGTDTAPLVVTATLSAAPAKKSRGKGAAAKGAAPAAPSTQVSAVELPTMEPEIITGTDTAPLVATAALCGAPANKSRGKAAAAKGAAPAAPPAQVSAVELLPVELASGTGNDTAPLVVKATLCGAPAKKSRGKSAAAKGAAPTAPPAQVSAVELPPVEPASSTGTDTAPLVVTATLCGAPAKKSRGKSATAKGAAATAPPAQVSALELPLVEPESSTGTDTAPLVAMATLCEVEESCVSLGVRALGDESNGWLVPCGFDAFFPSDTRALAPPLSLTCKRCPRAFGSLGEVRIF